MSEMIFRSRSGAPSKMPPGPRGHLLLGTYRQIQQDPLKFMLETSQQYGDAVRFRFFINWYGYMFLNPDHNKHILQDNNRNYTKEHPVFLALRPLVGMGLLTNDGDSWRRQRRLAQPAFHHKRIAGFGEIMTGAALETLERWQPWIEKGQPVEIGREMARLALQVVSKSLFSLDASGEADSVGGAFTFANKYIAESSARPFSAYLMGLPTPGNRRLRSAIQTLDRVVYKIIDDRRQNKVETGDLLEMLMSARDEETGEGMDSRQLRDEVMTLLLAGHETTANALTWCFYLLSQHPQVEDRLRAELSQVLGGRPPAVEDLPRLEYTRRVIDETLRLYPPAYAIGRYAQAADQVGGYDLPAGSILMLSPYLTHRHPDFWDDPEKFDPDRFTPERFAGLPRYAYLPFGGGPRLCIGNQFALTEAQLVLATLAQRVRLALVPGHPVEPEAMITLRPRYGMKMMAAPGRIIQPATSFR